MLLLLQTGFRLGVRFDKARGGAAASIFDSAVFALLGLLLGFAFAGAVDRLDKRRDLIVAEPMICRPPICDWTRSRQKPSRPEGSWSGNTSRRDQGLSRHRRRA